MDDVSIREIRNTKPTVTGAEALEVVETLLSGKGNGVDRWVEYRSDKLPYIEQLATQYANHHATIETKYIKHYSHQPLHVIHAKGRIPFEGNDQFKYAYCLLYSNGAVMILDIDVYNSIIFLWIREDTAETFQYPDPT